MLIYPSSHRHGSVKNGCISNRILAFEKKSAIFHIFHGSLRVFRRLRNSRISSWRLGAKHGEKLEDGFGKTLILSCCSFLDLSPRDNWLVSNGALHTAHWKQAKPNHQMSHFSNVDLWWHGGATHANSGLSALCLLRAQFETLLYHAKRT